MPSSKKQPRILLIALSGIGNVIMQSPAIATVRQKYPQAHITAWVAPRGTRALMENNQNIDEVIEMPIKGSPWEHIRQMMHLRNGRYDIGIVLSPGQLIKSATYMFAAGIPERVGASYPFRGNPKSTLFLTKFIDEQDNIHDIEQNLRIVSLLGATGASPYYEVTLPPQADKEAERIVATMSVPSNKILIGLHAGSAPDLAFKRWPLDRFAQVATSLIQKHNAHMVLFGGPDEEEQKKELASLIAKSTSLNSVSTVSAPLLVTASVMKRCRLMLANDSGLMHLAAAVGVETVGLFGPTSEVLTGPRGKISHVIHAEGTKPVYSTETGASLDEQPHETILAITPQRVIDTVSRILQQ